MEKNNTPFRTFVTERRDGNGNGLYSAVRNFLTPSREKHYT